MDSDFDALGLLRDYTPNVAAGRRPQGVRSTRPGREGSLWEHCEKSDDGWVMGCTDSEMTLLDPEKMILIFG